MKKNMSPEEFLNAIMESEPGESCPVRRTLELLGGKWRTHVIYALCQKRTLRFGELKKTIPRITNTMLTNTLRDLEKFGVVCRRQFNEIPPRVEYSLSEKGRALLPVFTEIANWANEYIRDK